jgi:superfamily II DNA/RNA helicase
LLFCQTVATAKLLANRMRAEGYTVSLLHGKDMPPAERDVSVSALERQAKAQQGKTTL